MDVITTFNGITLKVGDPVHDRDGNVIGKIRSWSPTEGREIKAIMSIRDPKMVKKLVPGRGTTYSMSCKLVPDE